MYKNVTANIKTKLIKKFKFKSLNKHTTHIDNLQFVVKQFLLDIKKVHIIINS